MAAESEPGATATTDSSTATVTKSSDLATLPAVGDIIRYTVTAQAKGDDGSYIPAITDSFDPATLQFVEAHVRVTADQLRLELESSAYSVFRTSERVQVADTLQQYLDDYGYDWDAAIIAEVSAALQERYDHFSDLRAQADASGDDLAAAQYAAQADAWQYGLDVVSYVEDWGIGEVEYFIEYANADAQDPDSIADQERYDSYLVAYEEALANGSVLMPVTAEVGDGTVTFPRDSSWMGEPVIIEYDMIYLGGDIVTNEACVTPTLQTTQQTEPTRLGGFRPPVVVTEESEEAQAVVYAQAAGSDPTCVTLTLAPPETTVHVAKEVRAAGADGYVRAADWGFDVVAGDFAGSDVTTVDGASWLLPLSNSARDVTFREVTAPNALLTDFTLVSVNCTVDGAPVAATVDATAKSATVAAVPAGADLSCVFQNDAKTSAAPVPPAKPAPALAKTGSESVIAAGAAALLLAAGATFTFLRKRRFSRS